MALSSLELQAMIRFVFDAARSAAPLALIGAACTLAVAPAAAVVTDTGSNPSLPLLLDLGGVGQLSNGCSSVLLAGGQYLLASAHCAPGTGSTVAFAGGSVTASIVSTVAAPGWDNATIGLNDLSISLLAAPVTTVAGYTFASTSPFGTPVVLAGYGGSGTGVTGASGPGGTLRWGFNDYEELLADDPVGPPPVFYGGSVVGYDFDDGTAAHNVFGSTGQAGEAMLAGGDSGGPSFAFLSGQWQVVGIHVGVDGDRGYGFGGVSYDQRVGEFAGWINSVTAVPEPASAALWLVGMAGLAGSAAARRRAG